MASEEDPCTTYSDPLSRSSLEASGCRAHSLCHGVFSPSLQVILAGFCLEFRLQSFLQLQCVSQQQAAAQCLAEELQAAFDTLKQRSRPAVEACAVIVLRNNEVLWPMSLYVVSFFHIRVSLLCHIAWPQLDYTPALASLIHSVLARLLHQSSSY